MVKENELAPDFALPDENGKIVRLSDFRGKKVVVYFYPEDDTPLCTNEACSLRDSFSEIQSKNAVVLGISPDGGASHQSFKTKFQLPFSLLSDPNKEMMKSWGTYGEKNMYGNIVVGVYRWTFLIDENGVVQKIIRKVNSKIHASQVLKFL